MAAMSPSERIARFLMNGTIAEDLTLPLLAESTDYPDLFPESLATQCARCGEGQCWQITRMPDGPIRTFTRLMYHCVACQGNAGFYLLLRWASAERDHLVLRKVAQFLPPGRASDPDP